ncbi:MAG: hypothetical protein JXQ90_18220 [Cyclobacteriaceae bacterium]
MTKITYLTILVLVLLSGCKSEEQGDDLDQCACPRPWVAYFSFKVVDVDSVDLVFDREVFNKEDIRLYAPNDPNDRLTVGPVSDDGHTYFTTSNFDNGFSYTLELNDSLKLDLLLDQKLIIPENQCCGNYLIDRLWVNGEVTCSGCASEKFLYIVVDM